MELQNAATWHISPCSLDSARPSPSNNLFPSVYPQQRPLALHFTILRRFCRQRRLRSMRVSTGTKPSTCWLFLHRGCCGLSSSLPCPATVLRAHQDSYLQSSSCSLEKHYSKWFNDAVSPVCFILCKMMKSTCRWQLFYFEHCLWKKYGFRVTIAHSW